MQITSKRSHSTTWHAKRTRLSTTANTRGLWKSGMDPSDSTEESRGRPRAGLTRIDHTGLPPPSLFFLLAAFFSLIPEQYPGQALPTHPLPLLPALKDVGRWLDFLAAGD